MGYESYPPPPLHRVKEMILLYYIKLNRLFLYSSGSFTKSWSHHIILRLIPGLRSASTESSYMGRHDTFSAMFDCHLLMYCIVGCSPADSSDANTGGYSQSLPTSRVTIIPVIFLVAWWQNPSRTFSISPVTTQLSLTYSRTDWATTLYTIPWSHTVAASSTPHFPVPLL